MNNYQRPWWLVVNKPAGLTTTVQEEAYPGERIFIIRGKPLVQGLAWLTWGPGGALLAVVILTWLAITFKVNVQPWITRGLFIIAFLGLPALAWGSVALLLHYLSQKHLRAERQATAEECIIRLDQKQGTFFYQTTQHPTEKEVAYDHIHRVRVAPIIGAQDVQAMRLILETDEGSVILLSEALGTLSQKNDLASEIQRALEDYSDK
jgi:hypothetical protein